MTNTNDMTVGSPTRAIIHFALPLVLGYILQQLYLIIDAAIVGQFVGVDALASVGASGAVVFLIIGFCNGACAGFAIPVAQRFGAKDYSRMRAFVSNAIRLSAFMALIITVLTTIYCAPILRVINTPDEIFEGAYTYLFIYFLTTPFTVAYNTLSGFIRALGDSKRPFYFLIVSSVVNILLDLFFILVLGMGVAGAAIATMIAQAVAAVLSFIYIRQRMQILIPATVEERLFRWELSSALIGYGLPMGLQTSITAFGCIMLQWANNSLGMLYVASFTAATRINGIFISVFENIGVSMATYCGQNYGAGRLKRVKQGIFAAMKIMIIYAAIITCIVYPFADQMIMLLVDSSKTEIIRNAVLFLHTANYFYPALGILTILRYSIQGLGYSNLSLFSGVAEMITRTVASIWVVPAFGFIGVCFGDPLAWVSAALFLIPATLWVYNRVKQRFIKYRITLR